MFKHFANTGLTPRYLFLLVAIFKILTTISNMSVSLSTSGRHIGCYIKTTGVQWGIMGYGLGWDHVE